MKSSTIISFPKNQSYTYHLPLSYETDNRPVNPPPSFDTVVCDRAERRGSLRKTAADNHHRLVVGKHFPKKHLINLEANLRAIDARKYLAAEAEKPPPR